MLWQCYTPLSFTQISSHNKIILKFPKFPNIPQNSQYSHKIPNIPGGNLPLSKFPGILHPYFQDFKNAISHMELPKNKLHWKWEWVGGVPTVFETSHVLPLCCWTLSAVDINMICLYFIICYSKRVPLIKMTTQTWLNYVTCGILNNDWI